jgi:hypothetical protein
VRATLVTCASRDVATPAIHPKLPTCFVTHKYISNIVNIEISVSSKRNSLTAHSNSVDHKEWSQHCSSQSGRHSSWRQADNAALSYVLNPIHSRVKKNYIWRTHLRLMWPEQTRHTHKHHTLRRASGAGIFYASINVRHRPPQSPFCQARHRCVCLASSTLAEHWV